jgi:prevent-host-death family protein
VIVNIHEAKTKLSSLLSRVAEGEEVVIAKAGRPVARLVPVQQRSGGRKPGHYAGRGYIADDFDAPLREIEDAFYSP